MNNQLLSTAVLSFPFFLMLSSPINWYEIRLSSKHLLTILRSAPNSWPTVKFVLKYIHAWPFPEALPTLLQPVGSTACSLNDGVEIRGCKVLEGKWVPLSTLRIQSPIKRLSQIKCGCLQQVSRGWHRDTGILKPRSLSISHGPLNFSFRPHIRLSSMPLQVL